MSSAIPPPPLGPETLRPSNDPTEELRRDMRELMGAVRECTRVTLEAKREMSRLSAKINMVALAQLAGEAKAIGHTSSLTEIRGRVKAIEDLLVAAE